MNNELDSIRSIEKAQLSRNDYFQSLLEQALKKGMLSVTDTERIQYESLGLLAYKAGRYNSGESSSIQIEKAQALLESVFFTIGVYLKTYQYPDDAVSAIKEESVESLYLKGRRQIDILLAKTRLVHGKLLRELIDTKNVYYSSTLKDGILGFFKLYRPEYFANEIHITADYPVFNPIPELSGIEFIKAYIEAAYYENRFCRFFSADDIDHLLCGYEENYKDLLFNIYELVLTAAIGCIIAGADFRCLDITDGGIKYLFNSFQDKSKGDIGKAVTEAAEELISQMHLSQGLSAYIKSSLPLIVRKIDASLRTSTLNRVFFTPAFPENNPTIVFSFGDKMDDELYRKVIEKINMCRLTEEKISVIKKHVSSLADMEDVLLDADLSAVEIKRIAGELQLPELAALSKKYQLDSEVDFSDRREREQLLRDVLKRFIAELPPAQKDILRKIEKALQDE